MSKTTSLFLLPTAFWLIGCIAMTPTHLNTSVVKSPESAILARKAFADAHHLPIEYANELGMKFMLVPPGSYFVGSPAGEEGRHAKETQHIVTLTKAYYVATTELTQKQWKLLYEENPSKFIGDNLPVEQVVYEDAVLYLKDLSDKGKIKYRLPTEAEWEIACRSGTTNPYAGNGDLNQMGWYSENSEQKTHEVASKEPNHFGLFDMHGNVWEWCSDTGLEYSATETVDPVSKSSNGGNRVRKGGSYITSKTICRSAYRNIYAPLVYRHQNTGFRIVFDADQLK